MSGYRPRPMERLCQGVDLDPWRDCVRVISRIASCGVDRVDILSRSNLSALSSTSERTYRYRLSGPGALAIEGLGTGNAALSVADCRRIDAASNGLPPTSNGPGTIDLGGSGGKPL